MWQGVDMLLAGFPHFVSPDDLSIDIIDGIRRAAIASVRKGRPRSRMVHRS